MAEFAASFTVSQSADCTTLTFLDTSNYITNDEGYATSSFDNRQFVISNSNYEAVTSLPMYNGDLTTTFALTSDQWLSVELQLFLDGNATTAADFTATHSVLSTCFLELCFSELVAATESGCSCGCGGACGCDNAQSDKVLLLQFIRAAQIFSQYSNPVLAQKQLDAGTAVCQANENNNNN